MAQIIQASIDLNKIDKSKIQTTDKNGNPFKNGAKYLNVSITINDDPDNYGNHASIAINQSKEEREAGQAKVYLGNGKIVWTQAAKETDHTRKTVGNWNNNNSTEDSLPF